MNILIGEGRNNFILEFNAESLTLNAERLKPDA